MLSMNIITYCSFLFGLLYVVEAYNDFEYGDRSYAMDLNDYDFESLVRPIMIDDEGDEENEEDEEDDTDGDNDSYDNYDDENADKRDIIKGPSYVPNIDDDSAENEIEQENYDVDSARKRKTIPKKKKSLLSSSDDLLARGKESLKEISELHDVPHVISTVGTKKNEVLDQVLEKEASLEGKKRGLMSANLINMLYDWKNKRHNTHTNTHAPHNSDNDVSTIQSDIGTFSDKPVANENDVSDENIEKPSVDVSSSSSTPEAGKATVTTKKSKGKINVMVNVNINEHPARRSGISEFPRSTYKKEVDSSKGFMQQYGALQKLREDAIENPDASGSGSTETNFAPGKSSQNSTVNLFAGLAFPNHDHIKIVNVVDGSDTESDDTDNEDADDDNISGSGEAQGDDVSMKTDKEKAHGMKLHTPTVGKEPSVILRKPVKPISQKLNFHKKYHPTHAYEESAEAEKGETPDTVFASKIAADREEKDNEMEHNDEHAERVDLVKQKQEKELSKAVEDEVSTDQKSKSNGVSKTLDSETEELAQATNTAKIKTPKTDAEEVSIEQIKGKDEKPKDIPKDSSMAEKTPDIPAEKDSSLEKDEDKVASSKATKDTALGDEKATAVKTPSIDKEDEQNDEILFTKKEREHKVEDVGGKENIGKSNNQDDKYETLEEVREKFKTWENRIEKDNDSISENVGEKDSSLKNKKVSEDVKSDKKSENIAKDSSSTASNSSIPEEKAKTWKEEEKLLLEKLKNPFLHESSKFKKEEEDDDDEEIKKEQQVEKVAADITKSANAEFDSVVDKVTSNVEKTDKERKDEKYTKDFQENADKAFTTIVNKVTSGQDLSVTPEVQMASKDKEVSPKIENVKFKEINKTENGNKNLMQLQKFKQQIMTEVSKIDNLQGEYGKDGRSASELKEAKTVLEKDLKVVKDLENNLKKKILTKKTAHKGHKKVKSKHQKHVKTSKHMAASTFSKPSDPTKDQEIIPDAKLGFDESPEQKKHKSKLDKMKKALNSYEYSYYVNKKEENKAKSKNHPLEEITNLLKAEISRLKKKGNKPDKQLNLIRGLVQQKIKAVIASGDLDKAAFHSLAPEIKELGTLLKSRINKEKKRKKWKKTKHIKGGRMSSKNIDMMKEPVRNPLDTFEKNKMQPGGPQSGIDKQINKMQSELSKLNNGSSPHKTQSTNSNNNQPSSTNSPNDLAQATQHISNAQNAFNTIANKNVSLDPKQSSNIKTLLNTLNKNLGEIYNKAQGVQQQQQPPQQMQQQYGTPNNTNYPGMQAGVDPNTQLQDIYIPASYTSDIQVPSQTNGQLVPQETTHHPGQGKHDTPTPEEDVDPDEGKGKALADDEPVDTLVEELERDITDVWSYRDIFPDADSLGLDNEKVHNTYANLGSLSGLNLRRALNRALRGEDVGLAVVGGSISKGGPFSEKGLDFVLRSYFYAIEDYWNKIIRPVTGSSMIIRDVSIGGIATDYYSYCLQNHLPNDKLTNIVLWELSANDLKRYEDEQKPKQQPLEQFTRNVLSYKAKPALIYINFFALFDWEPDLAAHCRNYEDEGEDDVARYYKITSLSWRNMVCPLLKAGNQPLFTKSNLFAEDSFHPSILAHAQMSYITIDYIRTEFLKNLVKMRRTNIADAVTRLQIPKSIYIPRAMYAQTYSWKPLCYTYMLVDNRSPNNTLAVDEENSGNFRYTVVREFKIRSDKIVGMETQNKDQFIRFRAHVPNHRGGSDEPYKRMGLMTFTDDRYAQVQFDSNKAIDINSKKRFLEGTVIKTIAENVKPGDHTLTVRSGSNGFLICALVLG